MKLSKKDERCGLCKKYKNGFCKVMAKEGCKDGGIVGEYDWCASFKKDTQNNDRNSERNKN